MNLLLEPPCLNAPLSNAPSLSPWSVSTYLRRGFRPCSRPGHDSLPRVAHPRDQDSRDVRSCTRAAGSGSISSQAAAAATSAIPAACSAAATSATADIGLLADVPGGVSRCRATEERHGVLRRPIHVSSHAGTAGSTAATAAFPTAGGAASSASLGDSPRRRSNRRRQHATAVPADLVRLDALRPTPRPRPAPTDGIVLGA